MNRRYRGAAFMRLSHVQLVLLALVIFVAPARAQQTDPTSETGTPPFASLRDSEIDRVNLLNDDLHVEIPLLTVKQRGTPSPGISPTIRRVGRKSGTKPLHPPQTQDDTSFSRLRQAAVSHGRSLVRWVGRSVGITS